MEDSWPQERFVLTEKSSFLLRCLVAVQGSNLRPSRLLRELRLDHVSDDEEARIPRNSLSWKRRNEGWLRRLGGEETCEP